MCFNVLVCYTAVSLDFTICVKCVTLETGLRAPKWRSRLLAASRDAAVLVTGVSRGRPGVEGWISSQGDHTTFHLPKSPHTAFGCCSRGHRREQRLGRLYEQCHACPWSQCRAWNHLCSFPFSTFATCSSGRSLLSVSKVLHGLCSPPAFHLRNSHPSRVSEMAGLLCMQFLCNKPSCSMNYFYHMCICTSEDHIPSAVLETIEAGEFFRVFASFMFLSLPILFFSPKCSFALQGKSFLSACFTVVAIMLSSPEPELRSYRWEKLAGSSVSLRKN